MKLYNVALEIAAMITQAKLYNVALEITVMITSFGFSFLFVFGKWMIQNHNVTRCVIGIAGLSTPC